MNTHTIHPCRCYYKIKYIQNFCVTSPNLIQKLQTTRISRQGLLKAFSYILNFYFLTFQKSVDWSFFKIQYFYICHTNLGKSAKKCTFWTLDLYIKLLWALQQIIMTSFRGHCLTTKVLVTFLSLPKTRTYFGSIGLETNPKKSFEFQDE